MRDPLKVSELDRWCKDNGGTMEDTIVEGYQGEELESKRCVLNNEGKERWDSESGEFIIDDTEYVEILENGAFRAESHSNETLEIKYSEWEQHADHGERRNQKEWDEGSGGLDYFEVINAWGDELNVRSPAHLGNDDDWVSLREVSVKTTKSKHEVEDQLTTQRDMEDHYRGMQFTDWVHDARRALNRGEENPPELHLHRLSNPEQWLEGTDMWEEYQEIVDEFEDEVEHDPLPCPDRREFIEIENGVELEGNVSDVWCNENETIVEFRGNDGEVYSLEGSPNGDSPIQLRVGSTEVASLSEDEVEFFGARSPTGVGQRA